jgi:hypothetical protein
LKTGKVVEVAFIIFHHLASEIEFQELVKEIDLLLMASGRGFDST